MLVIGLFSLLYTLKVNCILFYFTKVFYFNYDNRYKIGDSKEFDLQRCRKEIEY